MMESTASLASDADARLAADLFALAHPVRLAIVRHLAQSDACCNKDVVGRVGLVRYTPDRQRSRYSLAPDRLNALAGAFDSLAKFACGCSPVPRGGDRTD
jgi:ArsR family transcriptional regulator, arsenate/arsenite/antimonite-responsive transcriptional repressor